MSKQKTTPRHSSLDNLLRAFFRREMPDPWPGLELSPSLGQGNGAVSPGRRFPLRAGLAAAAALFFASYLLIASFFPANPPSVNGVDNQYIIGKKLQLKPRPLGHVIDQPSLVPSRAGGKKVQ